MKTEWNEPCSLSLEKSLNRCRTTYLVASLMAGIVVVLLYWMFSLFVFWLPWDPFSIAIAVAMGLCISLQLIGIPWFLSQMREAFHYPVSPGGDQGGSLSALLKAQLCDRKTCYIIVCFILLPFIFLNVAAIIQAGSTPFFAAEHTVAALLLDMYNYGLGYVLLYLFALIVWLLIVVASTLHDAQRAPERKEIPVDILDPDGVGGLGVIQALVRSLLTYYFIVVTLLIISYLSPTQIWSYEALFVIALFVAGILFFFIGFGSIRNIVRGRAAEEIGAVNERIRTRYNQMKEKISVGEEPDVEPLKKLQSVIDVWYTERNRIMTLYEKNRAYDIRTIGQSVASLIVPVLAFLVQLSSGADALRKLLSIIPLT
jgi:hypothetical protein